MNMELFNELSKFILETSIKYKIDETHNISHSMNVLHLAHAIYETELLTNPSIVAHKNIIYLAAALHDMCDKKYMNEAEGLAEIKAFLNYKITDAENDAIASIITNLEMDHHDYFKNFESYKKLHEADVIKEIIDHSIHNAPKELQQHISQNPLPLPCTSLRTPRFSASQSDAPADSWGTGSTISGSTWNLTFRRLSGEADFFG